MYVNSINYFRGISVIFIVFGHSLGLADFTYDSIAGNTLFNITKGGTSFFVFISGFLFHHIFYEKFKFKGFIIKKIKYVLLPYLILSQDFYQRYFFIKYFFKSVWSIVIFSDTEALSHWSWSKFYWLLVYSFYYDRFCNVSYFCSLHKTQAEIPDLNSPFSAHLFSFYA